MGFPVVLTVDVVPVALLVPLDVEPVPVEVDPVPVEIEPVPVEVLVAVALVEALVEVLAEVLVLITGGTSPSVLGPSGN